MLSSSSSSKSDEFVQPDPLQLPYAGVHSMLCFLQVHLVVLQSVLQLHLMMRIKCSGAGARVVCCGTNPLSHTCHPQSVG